MKANPQKTILLVEDEAIISLLEQTQLEKVGYAVTTAMSGEEAVEIFTNNAAIDLVLMDIDLGSGIDGTIAAEHILKKREIPVVFLSSHTEPEIVEKTEKITSYGYVVKNSSITVLEASMKMAFKLFDAKREIQEKADHLRASEVRFRAISEFSHSAICIIDESGKITWCNDRMIEMGGYSLETFYGAESFVHFLAPESISFVVSNFQKVIAGQPYEHHYRFFFIRADGKKRLCDKHMMDFIDLQGRRNVILDMADVTNLVGTEKTG